MMDRYIVRELIVPFIAGSLVIAFLFAANQLIFILKTFNVQNVPVSAMVQMIFYRMPFWLNMTLPAGISLAASLAITRLSRESEITAMRAAGVRVVRVILPVVLFGFVVAVGNYFLVEKVMPKSEAKARKLEIDAGVANAAPGYLTNVWLNLKQYRATFGSVTRQPDDSLLVKDIVLGDRPQAETVTILTSPAGRYLNGIWTLDDVSFTTVSPKTHKVTLGHAAKVTINQPLFINDLFDQQEPTDRTSAELAEAIRAGKRLGHDMTHEEILFHERFSVPAACIIFAMVAPIFALIFARTGSFVGVLLSFVLVLLYYNGFVISTEIVGRNHWLSPFLAAWAPNIIFAGLGLLAFRRLE
ncbi:MAG TPA: LptF/LptG family permease [Fimbriimonadaceae bacterium]|nr:LptF/LptG family permease [Fimbriimonadaceae bacterium]